MEETVGETGIADLTQTLRRMIMEDGTEVVVDGIMTTPMKIMATGDLTLIRETAGAITTTTMVSGAIAGAVVGEIMDMMEVREGQTQTQEVIMAEVKTVEVIIMEAMAMAEARTVEAIMEEARIVEVTGLEVGLGSRLHPPRTRGRMLASLLV